MVAHHPRLSAQVLIPRLLLWIAALDHLVLADNLTNPLSVFRSRPDLQAPILTIYNQTPELVTPGYIFIGPYQALQEGPYIYDNDGNLVWSGFGVSGAPNAHGVRVCDYLGSKTDHLCFFQGKQMLGYAHGQGVILDNSYRFVRSVGAGGPQAAIDQHEFLVLPGGRSALMTIYRPRAYDLTEFGIPNGMGYIQESIFQEVDIESGEVLFEWDSLDHIHPSESFVGPGTTEISGDGLTKDTPWDYFHINSIDKNSDGDYLISARHVSCIYKISGKDGTVMWRLLGLHSTFQPTNFDFSSQHDARFMSENTTHTVISLFDNASNGFNQTKPNSQGLIVAINHIDMTATSLREYDAPDINGGLLSKSQGNTQVLPNGNVFSGWGNNAFMSEHLEDSTPVWYGSIALTGTMIYRCYKYNWTATPLTTPTLWTYSKTGDGASGMVFYISWNGATEVRQWNFYTASKKDGPYTLSKTVKKDGFETTYKHDKFARYSYAEAVDGAGKVLRRGVNVETFVPSQTLAVLCDDFACQDTSEAETEEAPPEESNEEVDEDIDEQLSEELDAAAAHAWIFNALGVFLVITALFLLSRKNVQRGLLLWTKNAYTWLRSRSQSGDGLGLRPWKRSYRRVPAEE